MILMDIKDILKMLKPAEPAGYMELESNQEAPSEKITVQIENLAYLADVERIQEKLRRNVILIVNMKELKDKDMNELKHAVTKIKKTCFALDGDIVAVSNDWLVAPPKGAKKKRGKGEELLGFGILPP